jgi:GT2 family glycosyltransferase
LEKSGGFDERYEMAWREDSDLQFNFMMHKIPIVKVNEAIVIHPVRKAPWGFSMKEQKKGLYNALLYKKYPALYRKKIQPGPAWSYYILIICFCISIFGLVINSSSIAIIAGSIWLLLTANFIIKRLSRSSHSISHVMEMIVTSFFIPFLSVYWQLYGAFKYRVLLF